MEAMICRWGRAESKDGRVGFAIQLIGLHSMELTYVLSDPNELSQFIEDAKEVLREMTKNSVDYIR